VLIEAKNYCGKNLSAVERPSALPAANQNKPNPPGSFELSGSKQQKLVTGYLLLIAHVVDADLSA
jgi:hypothetical protein